MSKISNENYIVVQGFMVNELNLKGNELMIYAIIYGFSQEERQVFTGSLQYLVDWTNSTKQTVLNCLQSLQEKELIGKNEKIINNVKFCEYYATNFNSIKKSLMGYSKNLNRGIQKNLIPIKKILPNNIENNIINNNIEDNIDKEIYKEIYKEIIDYLNLKAGTNYKSTSKFNKQKIDARLNEGYTIEDFKKVIDNKCSEWLNNDMEKYLRPETLFGTKFENYLNQKPKKRTLKDISMEEIQRAIDYERSQL